MLNERRKRGKSVTCVQGALSLGQLVHLLVPFGVGESHQRDFVSQPGKCKREECRLFDPVMERGEEENVLSRLCMLNEGPHLLHRRRQRFRQTAKVIVILAGTILLPERVIELGSQRQLANEVAEGVFVEHSFVFWLQLHCS